MNKTWYWVIGIFIVLFFIGLFIPNNDAENTLNDADDTLNAKESLDKNKFNQLAIKFLYDNGFCYDGMIDEGKECGDGDYPFIRVYNSEDFTEQGKRLLVTQVTDDLYNEFPELYNEEIVYIFRNINQETIDRIYVKENKWDR